MILVYLNIKRPIYIDKNLLKLDSKVEIVENEKLIYGR